MWRVWEAVGHSMRQHSIRGGNVSQRSFPQSSQEESGMSKLTINCSQGMSATDKFESTLSIGQPVEQGAFYQACIHLSEMDERRSRTFSAAAGSIEPMPQAGVRRDCLARVSLGMPHS